MPYTVSIPGLDGDLHTEGGIPLGPFELDRYKYLVGATGGCSHRIGKLLKNWGASIARPQRPRAVPEPRNCTFASCCSSVAQRQSLGEGRAWRRHLNHGCCVGVSELSRSLATEAQPAPARLQETSKPTPDEDS